MKQNTSTGVLIVGCGSIGQRHIRSFAGTGKAILFGCDTEVSKRNIVEAAYGIQCFSKIEEALNREDIQAVVIATPAPTHIALASQAARAGKHILIEKPLALHLSGIHELIALAQQNSLATAVAYVYRFRRLFEAMKNYVDDVDLGEPLLAILKGGQPFDEKRPGYDQTYFAQHETGGGVIQDGLCHYSDLLSWFIGPCDRLTAHAIHACLPKVDVEDTVTLIGQYGQTHASIHINLFQAPTDFTMEIHFQRGSVKAELHQSRWGYFWKGDSDWTWNKNQDQDPDEPFTAQAHAFLGLIRQQPSQIATLQEAANHVQLIEKALELSRADNSLETVIYPNFQS